MNRSDKLAALQSRLRQFVVERDWGQFHDPKNLAMAVASESGELLSEFRWTPNSLADAYLLDDIVRSRVQDEIADVAITLLLLCERCNIDLLEAVDHKLGINEERYPISESKGKAERPQ